jgi:ABC-type uncharacterized transport system substrate-binding protein
MIGRCTRRLNDWHFRLFFACLTMAVAGCAGVPTAVQDVPPIAAPETEAEAEPPPELSGPVGEQAEAPPPAPAVAQSTPRSFSGKAAIVLSGRSPSFEQVATELGHLLEQSLVYNLADKSQSPEDAFAGIAESGAAIVIAIGFSAAEAATALSPVPVVYCQVFNFKTGAGVSVPVKGVAAIPPLSMQIEAWQKIDPGLRDIGAILGSGHEKLIAEAEGAAEAKGLAFHYQLAASDRETLYLFKRMAPDIDGFWLFPDNRILSVTTLRAMLDIAARHGVRVAVFNEALLQLGVSVSTAAVESDIAETVLVVAEQLLSGAAASVPHLTPLHSLKVRETASAADSRKALAASSHEAGPAPKARL